MENPKETKDNKDKELEGFVFFVWSYFSQSSQKKRLRLFPFRENNQNSTSKDFSVETL